MTVHRSSRPPARKRSVEHAYGITSHCPDSASPQRLLALNRRHWCVESTHHILDTAFDEDRCRIRTGHGPREHLPTPALRHRPHLRPFPLRRRRTAKTPAKHPPRLRLPEIDAQHPPITKSRYSRWENKLAVAFGAIPSATAGARRAMPDEGACRCARYRALQPERGSLTLASGWPMARPFNHQRSNPTATLGRDRQPAPRRNGQVRRNRGQML